MSLSPEIIILLMFSTLMLLMLTGQRVFAAMGFVGVVAALFLWGDGSSALGFNAAIIRPLGFPIEQAARKLALLLDESRIRKISGTALKDNITGLENLPQ